MALYLLAQGYQKMQQICLLTVCEYDLQMFHLIYTWIEVHIHNTWRQRLILLYIHHMITYPGMWYGSGVIKVDFLPMLCALLSRLKYCYHGNSFAHRVAKQPLPDRRPSPRLRSTRCAWIGWGPAIISSWHSS